MTTFYFGNPDTDQSNRAPLPEYDYSKQGKSIQYLASDGLVAAANIAISLGQPLLLTGEPGCGKTQFAESLADELGLPLHQFNTKSTSAAKDLLYHYDAIAHFQRNQISNKPNSGNDSSALDALPFIRLQGLGLAIVNSNPCWPFSQKGQQPARSVLLIDEIDKAPRDFPNDLLHELDRMNFSIPELNGQEFRANPRQPPIVVITSNSERHLPDAFLRRCSYFHIEFPSREILEKIVLLHLNNFQGQPLLASTLDYFNTIRQRGLGKNPGISELIQFLDALQKRTLALDKTLLEQVDKAEQCLGVILKSPNDLEIARSLLSR